MPFTRDEVDKVIITAAILKAGEINKHADREDKINSSNRMIEKFRSKYSYEEIFEIAGVTENKTHISTATKSELISLTDFIGNCDFSVV